MKRAITLLGLVTALMAAPASAVTVVQIDSPTNPAGTYFFTTFADATNVTAAFGATTTGASTAFDYEFEFTLSQVGIGSGSISTSFSGTGTSLTISQLIVNNVSYTVPDTPSGQALSVGGIPIYQNVENTFEVIGMTGPNADAGTFSGTATFSAVPEPATWATFLIGFVFLGLGIRRRAAQAIREADFLPALSVVTAILPSRRFPAQQRFLAQ